ncbi:MAG TPA: hypothetical protein VK729_10475 [Silvibacterium sp.]|nr:hypothetical protein [Silvibacterium sp.]
MKNWQVIGLLTLVVLLAAGTYLGYVFHERNEPGVQQKAQGPQRQLTDDDVVLPRKLYIADLKSAKDLIGKTVWVQSGYALDYYPYAAGRVEFAHPAGVLPSIQALQIENIITEKAPANLAMRIPLGDKQVFALFKVPNEVKQYATAIGTIQGSDSTYYTDQIFYYDDPHRMYKHWPTDVWQAVDQHQPKPGMNELQVAMALGTIQQSESSDYGNRTVTYDAGGKKWAVSFEKDKATKVTPE